MIFEARQKGYQSLHLQISGDDSRILAWPWEALRDPSAGVFAHICQIERRLNKTLDPLPLSQALPKDQVNILLITARPYKNDVQYRSVSRLLVELVEKYNLPASVHVLRPPTFENLREHLRQNSDFYHILHFDGHGAYGHVSPDAGSGFTFSGKEGCLVFEKEDGEADPVRADQLSTLLRDYAVPAVVLNACQSGMIDEQADDPFASVASSLLKSGVRSVVAMAWSLYVSGAQIFLPEFYKRLFETGSVAQAARAGRQKMFEKPERICSREKYPLQDWLVPVVYQQDPVDFSFAAEFKKNAGTGKFKLEDSQLPQEVQDEENPYGFIGRDGPILELERAMRAKPAGILVHGLGGVGKTTLARGFVQWLNSTQGLGKGCFWIAFNEIRCAEYVFNRMGEKIFGKDFALASSEQKMEALTRALKENQFVIIWDNFESVCGIPGTEVTPFLPGKDRNELLLFLKKLRAGKTKVIITSRSEEEWLGIERRKIGISGLTKEEQWLFLEQIFGDMGIRINRDDADLVKVMELLNGHPLSMRVILPMLEKQNAGSVIQALETGMDELKKDGDEINARLYAILEYAQTALPDELKPLLVPLAMHERFVHPDYLENMAKQADESISREQVNHFAHALVYMGLLFDRGSAIYELHPALTGFLRASVLRHENEQKRDTWARGFTDVMGSLANDLVSREAHEQRVPFHIFGGSFYYAMKEAERLGMEVYYRAILQSLAVYAQNTLNYKEAQDLFEHYGKFNKKTGNHENEARAYHHLGMIAAEQRDFKSAEKWYRKSLDIKEKQGNEHGAAITYGQLGIIAGFQENFEESGKWLIKCIISFARCDDSFAAQRNTNNFMVFYKQSPPKPKPNSKPCGNRPGWGKCRV